MKRESRDALLAAVGTALCAAAAAQSPQGDDAAPSKDYEESIAFADYLGSDDLRASELLGGRVLDENGEEIGEIEDVIVSRDDDVVTAIVAVGGFLDVGSKLVGVPYEELRISPEGEDFYVAMSAEELQARPEYRFEERDADSLGDLQGRASPPSESAGQSDDDPIIEQREQREAASRSTVVAEVDDGGSSRAAAAGQVSQQQSSEHRAAAQQSEQQSASAEADEAQSVEEGQGDEQIETLRSADRRVSELIGAKVVTAEGDEVGKIDDLVISTDDQSMDAVLSVGGLLGVGARLVRVPVEELELEQSGQAQGDDETAVRLSMTVDELTLQPLFEYEETRISSAGPF